MGFITDQLRKRLADRKKSKKLNKSYQKIPKKDITFLPATTAASSITDHVNLRLQALINQVGGIDKFSEGDFTINFIDKTKESDIIQKSNKVLGKKIARESVSSSSTFGSSGTSQPTVYDWEAVEEETVSELAPNVSADQLQYYMIIIEYTQIKEVV
ncbi:hypothetical protein H8D85_00740 [bacterium]|nr:hypothetical protein [bacterium]